MIGTYEYTSPILVETPTIFSVKRWSTDNVSTIYQLMIAKLILYLQCINLIHIAKKVDQIH